MAGFITPTELKAYPLPVTDKQWEKITDEQIQTVIDYATQNIKDYLDRDIVITSYTERIVGSGRSTLILDAYPIVSLSSVSSRDYTETIANYSTSDFLIRANSGIIEWIDKLRNAFWSTRIWVVQYTAGYATIPGPVKHATALQTVQMLQPLFRGGSNFAQVELVEETNEQIVDMLEKYKRKRIG